MILKLLLVAGVIFFVYILFFKQKTTKSQTSSSSKKREPIEADELVQCQTCHVYVEVEEAILSGSKYYCSSECVDEA